MSASSRLLLPENLPDRRSAGRLTVALPIILDLGSRKLGARLLDIALGGGRVELDVVPLPHSHLTLRCGTIAVMAKVAWTRGNHVGLTFRSLLTDRQVGEQVRRSIALASRRDSMSAPGDAV